MESTVGGLDPQKEKQKSVKEFKKQFAYWNVGEKSYRLKLTAGQIDRLEGKYGKNIATLLMDEDGVPPLSVMLTTIQAAMIKWEHGKTYTDIQQIYDVYCENGGNQQDLFKDVIVPILVVSGFFTPKMAAEIQAYVESEL